MVYYPRRPSFKQFSVFFIHKTIHLTWCQKTVPENSMVAYGDEWAELHTFLNVAVDKRDWFDLTSTFVSFEEVSSFPIIREG